MMKRIKLAATLLCAVLFVGAMGTPGTVAQAAKKPMVTRAFGHVLRAAHNDLKHGKYDAALKQLAKARTLPKPSPYDTHVINELTLYAEYKLHNLAAAAKAMQATLDDGFTPKSAVRSRVKNLAVIYYQLKDYGKAAQFGQRAIKGGFADSTTYTIVSQAFFLSGNYKATVHFTRNLVNDEIRRGQKPPENQMQIVLDSCVKLKDNTCINHTLEHLVTYYPRPEYWQNIMLSLFNSRKAESSDVDMLNVYRLALDVGALTMPSQYIEMAQLALEQGSPGDAEQVLEQGYGKNVYKSVDVRQHAARLLKTAKKEAKSDQSALPKLASQAAISAKGEKDIALGLAYLGYKHYDKAVSALSQGLAKGGVKDEAQARLLLGIAQLKAGQANKAMSTFKKVKGNAVLAQLARLWSLRAKSSMHS